MGGRRRESMYPQPPMDPRASYPYSPPPAAGGVPPMAAPAMPWPSQTENGVRQISYAMIIFAVVSIVTVVLTAALMSLVAGILAGTGGFPDPGTIGALLAVVAAGCAILILEVVGAVFGLMGVLALNKGQYEFGPEHQRRIGRGIIALVLGIVVPFAGNTVSGLFIAFGSPLPTPGLIPAFSALQIAVTAAFGIFATLAVGFGLLWLVEMLVTPVGRVRAWLAVGLGVVATLVAAVGSFAVLSTLPTVPQPGDIMLLFIPSIGAAAVSVASIAMWFLVYRGVLTRFRTGELRAAPPPMAYSPYYPPYYPAPMYAPPYVPTAPQPPPAQPPPQPAPAKPEERPAEKAAEKPPEGG